MEKFKSLDDKIVPCEYLRKAGEQALQKAIELMGEDGPGVYRKDKIFCTRACPMAPKGCKVEIKAHVVAATEVIESRVLPPKVVYLMEGQKIYFEVGGKGCLEGVLFKPTRQKK